MKKDNAARFSYNAKDYVCNFSMYVIMDFIKTGNKNIKFAFIHIPINYNLKKAVNYIELKIKEIAGGSYGNSC